MNANELKTLLANIQDQMADAEAEHEKAVAANDFESADMITDMFTVLADRETDIEARIKEAGRPANRGCSITRSLISANID